MSTDCPTEIIVIRHGETTWNVEGRLQGHLDSELSPLGHQQAAALAERLAGETFDALYSSDLRRGYDTATYIAKRTACAVIADARLRERCLGIFQGLTWTEIRQRYPTDYAKFKSRDPDYVIPEGESYAVKQRRIVDRLEPIEQQHRGQRVIVVTHGGVLDSVFRHTLQIRLDAPRRWKLYNASLNTFFVADGAWMLGTWGDTQHLNTVGSLDDY